ncbi:cytochrome b [Rhizobium oryziradicis]|uniref:Cytochrome B n=1 Tax=Rhizobium oryziradicis TaxID=1867956 RepID=A0A1Q8ZS91_9HYPH|nr:cytochrome b [Rhizobium oryziradicis]OLP44947.1 cytochrome B [Rhizobium oryziradicis]
MNNLDLSSRTTSADEKRLRNSTATYGLIAVLFHWTIALLFIAQLALGYLMSGDDVDPALQFNLFQYHKSIGFVVLALAIPRVIWSMLSTKPHPPAGTGRVAHIGARLAHAALLFLTVAVPLAGWAVVSTSPLQIPSYVFDIVVIPGLPLEISDASEALWTDVHETLAYLAAAIVLLHVAAAVWHHVIRKDVTLKRMMPLVSRRKSAK